MYYCLFLFSLIASTLCAEIFEENDVQYAYDVEKNTDKSVIKYLVDTSYYDQFSADVLGVYVLSSEVPMPIFEYTHKMAQILDRLVYIKTTDANNLRIEFQKISDINLYEKFAQKYENHHTEIRDISFMLKSGNFNNLKALYTKIYNYIIRKEDFYARQNNETGVEFCDDIKKTILKPLNKIGKIDKTVTNNIRDKEISSLSAYELKFIWNDFKKYNLNVIETFFENNKDKIYSVNDSNGFDVTLNEEESNNNVYYFLCINIFGQNWYLELYDDYVSDIHRISLVRL